MRKLKKGDKVVVISGKEKGKQGVLLRLVSEDRVIVENVNLIKKHQKTNMQKKVTGKIIQKESPLHISSVKLFNPIKGKPERVGIKILSNNKKVRYFKSNNEIIDI